MQNEPNAGAHARIAEAVGNGWPAYEVSTAQVEKIIEGSTTLASSLAIAMVVSLPILAVEAVLAEAHTYGLVKA